MSIDRLIELWTDLFLWAIVFFALFPLLALWMPCNPKQPLWRKDTITDLIYYFITPVLTNMARFAFLVGSSNLIFYGVPDEEIAAYFINGFGPISTLPIWLQVAIMFILADFLLYWIHRFFHTARAWKYHAIHHSSETIDWLSTYRFHPINAWLAFSLVDTIILLLGFSPACLGALAIFNTIYSAMVHANLNWTFGPFKYLFASPVFHRWHHTAQEEGMDKNFAPTIPLLDVIFGTFYMPQNRLPERYGVPGSNIPSSFLGQLLWPFKAK